MIRKIYRNLFLQREKFIMKILNGGSNDFYQSLKELNIKGLRNTDERFEKYKLKNILKEDFEVLDIGCNKGFFSIVTSRFVKNVTGVDNKFINIQIGKQAMKKLNIENVKLIKKDFKKFKTSKKFDLIYSFAIHHWVGLSFENYIKKINTFLKKDGIIVFESHDLDTLDLYLEPKLKIFKELGFKEIFKTKEYENGKRVTIIFKKQ